MSERPNRDPRVNSLHRSGIRFYKNKLSASLYTKICFCQLKKEAKIKN